MLVRQCSRPIGEWCRTTGFLDLAVGETVILLHPPLPVVGVSTRMCDGCQQNDSLADGFLDRRFNSFGTKDTGHCQSATWPGRQQTTWGCGVGWLALYFSSAFGSKESSNTPMHENWLHSRSHIPTWFSAEAQRGMRGRGT